MCSYLVQAAQAEPLHVGTLPYEIDCHVWVVVEAVRHSCVACWNDDVQLAAGYHVRQECSVVDEQIEDLLVRAQAGALAARAWEGDLSGEHPGG